MPTSKLEAQITVPTGGWSMSLTDQTAGPTTCTIPAGTYYHSTAGSTANDFAAEVAAQANAVMTQTWSATVGAGDAETGKFTISCTGTTCTVTFTDTELRDLMGYTGNLSGSTSYQTTNHVQALWISTYGHQKKNAGTSGATLVSNQQIALNSNGNVFSVMGRSYVETAIVWPMEPRNKTFAENETQTNQSFQTFLQDGIWGTAAWGTSAGPVRFYPDAGDSATYGTYSVLGMETWSPDSVVEHFAAGRWGIVMPRLIVVPS